MKEGANYKEDFEEKRHERLYQLVRRDTVLSNEHGVWRIMQDLDIQEEHASTS